MQWSDYFFITERIGSRYFVIAGLAFLICYVLLKKRINFSKIQHRYPKIKDYIREVSYSILTILIFGVVFVLLVRNPAIRPYTRFYTDIEQHGRLWFWLAFPIMLVMHDAYFYWSHRLMHHPRIFKFFHLVHHQSTNPSPWAAYAFHPLEAVVEAGILPLFLFTMPIHGYHLALFFLFMIIYNVYGHLGWELYPKGFSKHWLGKWINTSVNHNQHHQYFKGNYGLYFLFWDRVMDTLRMDYVKQFDDVKSRVRKPG